MNATIVHAIYNVCRLLETIGSNIQSKQLPEHSLKSYM